MPVTVVDIPDLTAAAALSGTDLWPVTQGTSVPVKATVSAMWTYIQGQTWPAGSVSAPGVKVGDADTGFYQTSGVLHAAVDGVEVWEANSTGLAIGAGVTPTEKLYIKTGAGVAARIKIESENVATISNGRYTADANAPAFVSVKSRGTVASPASVANSDNVFSFLVQAHNGTSLQTIADLSMDINDGSFSSSSMATRFRINLAPTGSTTRVEALQLQHSTGLSLFSNVVIDENRLHRLRSYTVGTLPAAGTAGRMAWASNCRVFNGTGTQEGAGVGTGGLVTDNGTAWKIAGTNVTAVA